MRKATVTIRLSAGLVERLDKLAVGLGTFGLSRPRVIEALVQGCPTGADALERMLRHAAGVDQPTRLPVDEVKLQAEYERGLAAGRAESRPAHELADRAWRLLVTDHPDFDAAFHCRAWLADHDIEVIHDEADGQLKLRE